jgi:nucleoside-triphosphatase THEP1
MRNNILITGPPRCGKSTLLMRIIQRLNVAARGFHTAEIRSNSGLREGFRLTTLSGREGILAHRSLTVGPRVGAYRVNLADLERIGVVELEEAIDDPATVLIVIDEIARMELFSDRFRRAAAAALDSPKALLGTIQVRRDPFLDAVRERPDTLVFPIDRATAEATADRILRRLEELLI